MSMTRTIVLRSPRCSARRAGARAGARPSPTAPELYPGEKALYEAASKEGMVVSFDTGPTWANWAAQFAAFKKRYPGRRDRPTTTWARRRPWSRSTRRATGRRPTPPITSRRPAVDAAKKNLVAPFKPVNFDKLPDVFRDPEGKWFTIHSLTIAFVVNTKLVKNVPQSWADLLKPEYKNSIVYLDPRSTGVGQVLTFAANFAHGGDMNNVQPGHRLSRQAAQVRQRAARARHHALRAVRQGRDPDLDLLRERRTQGQAHRRPGRRGGGGRSRRKPRPRRRTASASSRTDRIRMPASSGSTSS